MVLAPSPDFYCGRTYALDPARGWTTPPTSSRGASEERCRRELTPTSRPPGSATSSSSPASLGVAGDALWAGRVEGPGSGSLLGWVHPAPPSNPGIPQPGPNPTPASCLSAPRRPLPGPEPLLLLLLREACPEGHTSYPGAQASATVAAMEGRHAQPESQRPGFRSCLGRTKPLDLPEAVCPAVNRTINPTCRVMVVDEADPVSV